MQETLVWIPGSERSTGEGIGYPLQYSWASLVAHLVENLPAVQETWVQSLGWEDPLEKGKATHSSILAWRIPWPVSGPITSWKIDGETVEAVSDFIFLGSKITAGGDCSHEIKRCLLLGRKVMTILDSILKSRDITLPTKIRLFKAMVFPVVMYGYESWTIKKAKCQRIDAFLNCGVGEDS